VPSRGTAPTTGAAATAPDERRLLTAITAATAERLGAAACSVALLDSDELVYVAASGAGAGQVIGLRLPSTRGIAGWVAASGQAIAVADVRTDARHDREAAASTGYLPTSILAVPAEDDEGPIGVLSVLDRHAAADDLSIAAAAAAQVAMVRALATSRSHLDAQLADPELADLRALLTRFGHRDAGQRRRAARVLGVLLEEA
jgi:GAF domain-containing protein